MSSASGRLITLGALVFFMLGSAERAWAPHFYPFTGHWYDFRGFEGSWSDARDGAASSTFLGVAGHLATVTSPEENDFIRLTFGLPNGLAWVGGRERDNDGIWRWAVGLEAGTQFSNGPLPTPPYDFANWGSGEPDDNANESFAAINLGPAFGSVQTGEWADFPSNPTASPIVGYIAEYDTVIPEPGTLALLGVGGLALLARRRVRRSHRS